MAAGLVAVLAVHVAGLAPPPQPGPRGRPAAGGPRAQRPGRAARARGAGVGDPGAAVYWWDPDSASYVDHHGHPMTSGAESLRRTCWRWSPIAGRCPGGHDRPLVDDPAILEPVAEALRLSTENGLLQEELAESLVQVRESRSRIVHASDEARRRIERDLHDGAQQLLISTGVKLNLASSGSIRNTT